MGIPERRRHPRRAVESPLILIRPGPKEVQDGAVLRDVSLDGLAFETTLPLDAGAPFEFALHVPNSGWVEGKGLVCWSKEAAGGAASAAPPSP